MEDLRQACSFVPHYYEGTLVTVVGIVGDRKTDIRLRTVIDGILQGRLEQGDDTLLSHTDLEALRELEPSASNDLIIDVANRLLSMVKPGYAARFTPNPERESLEIFKR